VEQVSQKYVRRKLDDLTPHPANPRQGDVGAIHQSIEANGFYGAVIVQKSTGYVLAGNHRMQAAAHAGATSLPVIEVDVDDATATRILLADNRTNDVATYDQDALAGLLKSLAEDGGLAGSGYDGDDVDALLADIASSGGDNSDEDEPNPGITVPEHPDSQPGAIYELGPHRLMCGDCRNPDHVDALMNGAPINIAFTSPPYADRRKYDESSGFRPIAPNDYVQWFRPVSEVVARHIAADGSWFVNIKPSVTPDGLDTELYVFDLVLAHVREWGWHFGTEFCWERMGVPKSVTRRFKNQYEPIYQFTRGDWKMRPDAVRHESDNVPIAGGPGVGDTSWGEHQGGNGQMFGAVKKRKHGTKRVMSDAQGQSYAPGLFIAPGLAYPGNRLPPLMSTHEATGHAAAFPVGLPEFFIKAYTDEADTVYDPFMGSGSTLIAAHRTGRIAYGMEISPAYCDVIRKRYAEHANRPDLMPEVHSRD
jgi:DNA modification methylase